LREVAPLSIEPVANEADRALWRELVERNGSDLPNSDVNFGAHLRYLIRISRPELQVVGCLQFSSPAWRIAERERWIGWDDTTRAQGLQRIVSNSRFLILPGCTFAISPALTWPRPPDACRSTGMRTTRGSPGCWKHSWIGADMPAPATGRQIG
jgi:hypothetical protein